MRQTEATWTLERAAFTAPYSQSIPALPFSHLCFYQQNHSTCHQLILNHANHFHHLFDQNVSTTAEEYRDIHGDGIVTAREKRTENQHVFKVSDASVLFYNTLAMAISTILSIVRHDEHLRHDVQETGPLSASRYEVSYSIGPIRKSLSQSPDAKGKQINFPKRHV